MYVCKELSYPSGNITQCKTWVVLPAQSDNLSINQEQADILTLAILKILILVFGWAILIKMLRK